MGEAILVKAGGGGNGYVNPEDQNIVDWQLKTELITNTKEYLVPKARNQEFTVLVFGGGGGSWYQNILMPNQPCAPHGASGNVNKNVFKLKRGESIPVIIGDGGINNRNGGTTSFGTYIAATGGGIVDIINKNAASGGVGAPALMYMMDCYNNPSSGYQFRQPVFILNAGKSYCGGGGGSIYLKIGSSVYTANGSNGGIYGGGGGTYVGDRVKTGGSGCGNGGNGTKDAENGTNTMNQIIDFNGYGNCGEVSGFMGQPSGNYKYAGGGGYGGEGSGEANWRNDIIICGAGGGYGGKARSGSIYGPNSGNYGSVTIVGSIGGDYGMNNWSWLFNGVGGYGEGRYGSGSASVYGATITGGPYDNGYNGICVLSYYAPVYNNG